MLFADGVEEDKPDAGQPVEGASAVDWDTWQPAAADLQNFFQAAANDVRSLSLGDIMVCMPPEQPGEQAAAGHAAPADLAVTAQCAAGPAAPADLAVAPQCAAGAAAPADLAVAAQRTGGAAAPASSSQLPAAASAQPCHVPNARPPALHVATENMARLVPDATNSTDAGEHLTALLLALCVVERLQEWPGRIAVRSKVLAVRREAQHDLEAVTAVEAAQDPAKLRKMLRAAQRLAGVEVAHVWLDLWGRYGWDWPPPLRRPSQPRSQPQSRTAAPGFSSTMQPITTAAQRIFFAALATRQCRAPGSRLDYNAMAGAWNAQVASCPEVRAAGVVSSITPALLRQYDLEHAQLLNSERCHYRACLSRLYKPAAPLAEQSPAPALAAGGPPTLPLPPGGWRSAADAGQLGSQAPEPWAGVLQGALQGQQCIGSNGLELPRPPLPPPLAAPTPIWAGTPQGQVLPLQVGQWMDATAAGALSPSPLLHGGWRAAAAVAALPASQAPEPQLWAASAPVLHETLSLLPAVLPALLPQGQTWRDTAGLQHSQLAAAMQGSVGMSSASAAAGRAGSQQGVQDFGPSVPPPAGGAGRPSSQQTLMDMLYRQAGARSSATAVAPAAAASGSMARAVSGSERPAKRLRGAGTGHGAGSQRPGPRQGAHNNKAKTCKKCEARGFPAAHHWMSPMQCASACRACTCVTGRPEQRKAVYLNDSGLCETPGCPFARAAAPYFKAEQAAAALRRGSA